MPRSISTDEYTVAEPTDNFDAPIPETSDEEGGWDEFNKIKSAGFLERFTPTNERKLIKILDDRPVKSYRQHWVDNSPVPKKSFVCEGKGNCPLCDKVGDKPQVRVLFNVVDMSGNAPEVKTWTVGSILTDTLSGYAQDEFTKPLNRNDLYWTISVSSTGKGRPNYNLNPVDADKLAKYNISALTDTQLENFNEVKADASSVRHSSQEELNQVADHVLAARNN